MTATPDTGGPAAAEPKVCHAFLRATFILGAECTTACGIRYTPTELDAPGPRCPDCWDALLALARAPLGDGAAELQNELLARLCAALDEPMEIPADHPAEPPYRMSWDRALDLVRGQRKVWADLLRRAELADAHWLNQYRQAAGTSVPMPTPSVTLTRDALDGGWVAQLPALAGVLSQGETIPGALRNLADALEEAAASVVIDAMLGTHPGPLATPTDPVRSAALEDLEHALTLALQAMAANDGCADPDDPDWRGPAIEQFREDLRGLGVTDAELDAAGICGESHG